MAETKWTSVSVRELNGMLLFIQFANIPDSPDIRVAKIRIQECIDFMLQNGMQEMKFEESDAIRNIKLAYAEYVDIKRFERR